MKTIGFRPCSKKVPFIKSGKLVIPDPDDDGYYDGYWWNKDEKMQVHELPEGAKDDTENGEYKGYEYYYYLNENYHDN